MNVQLKTNDLEAFWMPFTANRQFKNAPRLFARAEGTAYFTPEGRRVLDGTSGLWCVNAGHCRPKIVAAIKEQAETLDFAGTFQMGHVKAFEAASRLVNVAPEGFDHVFFTNSGSESVETALKMALAYHRAKGNATKVRLIGRERGYHGVNFGGMSVAAWSTTASGSARWWLVSIICATRTTWREMLFLRASPSTARNSQTIWNGLFSCMTPRRSRP